jgi:hypothetical protein
VGGGRQQTKSKVTKGRVIHWELKIRVLSLNHLLATTKRQKKQCQCCALKTWWWLEALATEGLGSSSRLKPVLVVLMRAVFLPRKLPANTHGSDSP